MSLNVTGECVGEAPGRIDMLGGVGDYSGGRVLQVATSAVTRVVATMGSGDDVVTMTSSFGSEKVSLSFLREALESSPDGGAVTPAALRAVRAFLAESGAEPWVFYVFGCVAAYALETGWLPARGSALQLSISSKVPLAQGVSSSASIEVATLRALDKVSGRLALTPLRTAHVAQATENYVVGAPCGLMDQLASSLGAAGKVLPILNRPDILDAAISLPQSVAVVGWPSGVEHSIGGSPYLDARTSAFMAKKVLEKTLNRTLKHLTELSPSELATVVDTLPSAITGAQFMDLYQNVDDALSVIDEKRVYDLRTAARFPVEENFRCASLRALTCK